MRITDIEYIEKPLGADRGDVVFSPDEVANEQATVDRLVDSMGVDINAQKARVKPATYRGFTQFWDEWKTFLKQRSGWASRHERSTYEKTLEFRERADAWFTRLHKEGVQLSSVKLPSPSQGGGPGTNKTLMWIGIAAVGVVGLFIIGKLVHTVMFGDAALEEAEREAERVIDQKRRKRHQRTLYSIS